MSDTRKTTFTVFTVSLVDAAGVVVGEVKIPASVSHVCSLGEEEALRGLVTAKQSTIDAVRSELSAVLSECGVADPGDMPTTVMVKRVAHELRVALFKLLHE